MMLPVELSRKEIVTDMADWYICPVIGAGTEDDPYRVDHAGSYDQAVIPCDMTTGAPLGTWALCRLLSSAEVEDIGHTVIPDRSRLLDEAEREALRLSVAARGVIWAPPLAGQPYARGDFHRAIAAHLWPAYRMPELV
jgi:hypothetical protein